ncbi:OppA family ABC transporter substrate-binding lipoprotein [Mesomycoplasma conjunctivae]|uniref:OppA family ABC transporter substrate-binding lipoprotein n=1 Tax=Mesomycoplasma conjunctivae TaxID=45361 RepID=UPI003DA5A462
MNKIVRKLSIGSIVTVSQVALFVSCAIQPAWQRQELNSNIDAATSSPNAFATVSNFFTNPSTIQIYYTTPFLIQTVNEGQLDIQAEGFDEDSKNKKDKSNIYKIKRPSYEYDSLVSAKAIVLTDKEGNEFIFDNDKHEKGYLPENSNSEGLTVRLTSDDKRSINSLFFRETLDKAVKVQLFIKDNIFWTDYKGELTKYPVLAKDYYYGYKWQRLLDKRYRAANGGGSKIDDEAKDKTPNLDPKSRYFDTTVNNFYLFDLFGLDVKDFDNETQFLQKYQGKNKELFDQEAITFHQDSSKGQTFFGAFFDKLIMSGTFQAMPSTFVDERVASLTKNNSQGQPSGIYGETGEALRFGFYWYGADFKKDLLFNSPYVLNHWDTHRKTYFINEHYPRSNWKERLPYVYKKINFLYSKYSSPSAFTNSQFNSFREQTIPSVSFDTLNDAQKNLVASNREEFGWRLTQVNKTNAVNNSYFLTLVPGSLKQNFRPEVGITVDDNYYPYNDNYAKLMFGASRSELAKGNVQVVKHISSGVGLQFRQIITNAWNLYTAAQTQTSQSQAWANFVAPDNKISTKANSKTPRDFYLQVNTTKLVDSQGNVYYTKDPETEKQQNFRNLNSAEEQYKAPNYSVLQAKMKEILDKFYQENNLSPTDKVEWSVLSWFINANQREIAAITNAAKAINDLDPRLNLKVTWPFTNLTRRINYIITGTGPLSFGGWNYDYDGIGTALDGRVQINGVGYAMLSVFDAQGPDSNLAKSYPEIYRYSQAAKKFFTPFAQKGYIRDFSEWQNATNAPDYGADNQHLDPDMTNFFTGSVIEEDNPDKPGEKRKVWKSFIDQINSKLAPGQQDASFDFGAQSASFNLQYQETHTDEQLVALVSELNSIFTTGLTDQISVPSKQPVVVLFNPNIESPYTDAYNFIPTDMLEIIPLREKAIKTKEKQANQQFGLESNTNNKGDK